MAPPVLLSAIATGIGLLTDKYMLEATNVVEEYQDDMVMTHSQKSFVKSAMYAGAILGMVTFGPLSDVFGRRACMIACSVITFAGGLLSTFAWDVQCLIFARIVTGIGMGGEYPLASSHSAESAQNSNDGARNVALLYLLGSGGGPVLCDLVTYLMDISGVEHALLWRLIFGIGTFLAGAGIVLRYLTTENSKKFKEAVKAAKGTRRSFLKFYWKPLLGTCLNWLLFDIVEYGLKQNDASIMGSVRSTLLTRTLVIPSLAIAPWLLTLYSSKRVQFCGLLGCVFWNGILACFYTQLQGNESLFFVIYVVQMSFQSLPGVTTMAISADIYPSIVKGTFAALSAASGKVGAVIGSYYFTMLADYEPPMMSRIFQIVTCTSVAACLLTLWATPFYDGATLDIAEDFAEQNMPAEAAAALYSGPQEGTKDFSDESGEEDETE